VLRYLATAAKGGQELQGKLRMEYQSKPVGD
jgi:hypothetical protein